MEGASKILCQTISWHNIRIIKYFTLSRFLIIGCGLSSSVENCRCVGSKPAPGIVANANSSAENLTMTSGLRLRSSFSLSILARLLSTYKNSFPPYYTIMVVNKSMLIIKITYSYKSNKLLIISFLH